MKPLIASALLFTCLVTPCSSTMAAELVLRKGDHICLVGNELGERMQHHNHWEALLHQAYPELQLTVRNLCFPGDEPEERIRSLDFGDPDAHLTHSQADVILYFFGFNESFHGAEGLDTFTAQMRSLVNHTLEQKYDGESAPRVVLVSPIASEDLGNPNITSGTQQNTQLARYTAALQAVAEETDVVFADLFTPTQTLFAASHDQLTLNGCHLNDAGYRKLAPILMKALGLNTNDTPPSAVLQAEIADKNFHWWHRYRAVNGYSIYGKRGLDGSDGTYTNRDVMERERVILDQMTANRDQRVWAVAAGQEVPANCDDSNTLPFYTVKTNVGGEDDPNRKRGKLGSLDYLPAAEQQKLFQMADGYEIQLVASEEDFPELANPVSINFDNQGRLWVTTMPSYPHWLPKTVLNDKVLILTDADGDGRADDCTVFADGLQRDSNWVTEEPGWRSSPTFCFCRTPTMTTWPTCEFAD